MLHNTHSLRLPELIPSDILSDLKVCRWHVGVIPPKEILEGAVPKTYVCVCGGGGGEAKGGGDLDYTERNTVITSMILR